MNSSIVFCHPRRCCNCLLLMILVKMFSSPFDLKPIGWEKKFARIRKIRNFQFCRFNSKVQFKYLISKYQQNLLLAIFNYAGLAISDVRFGDIKLEIFLSGFILFHYGILRILQYFQIWRERAATCNWPK